jgi:zeaxanthin epoxidase
MKRFILLPFLLADTLSAFVLPLTPRFARTKVRAATIESVIRKPETNDRVQQVRERFRQAAQDAAMAKGCTHSGDEWWRQELPNSMIVSDERPLRVLITGGGVAGLVTAAACHSKGMKVAIFEQASQYAPYGGPIQIQSNALRALERINPKVCEEIVKAGTVTADRVSGLKIGYRKGVFLGLGKQYEKGDWLVRFDTLQPALRAGLRPTGT